jgi:hypothetical protein
LSTQFDDGAWFVKTRTWPFQTEFDSGFPFGHDQWISVGATAWASMAMLLAITSDSPPVVSRYGDPGTSLAESRQLPSDSDSTAEPVAKVSLKEVDFVRDVRPLLQRSCVGCHEGDVPEGGLRVTSRQGFLDGGESLEPAMTPGDSNNSRMIRILTGKVDGLSMPPVDAREEFPALTKLEIAQLEAWIDAGAGWPEDAKLDRPDR